MADLKAALAELGHDGARTLGADTASVSVPVRVYQNKLDSLLDISKGRHPGSDFAPYLIVASYARRF